MLAYAANAPRHAERRGSPNAMLFIIAAHVAAVAALMSAKMEFTPTVFDPPTKVDLIPIENPPPPRPAEPNRPTQPQPFARPEPLVPMPRLDTPAAEPTPPLPDIRDLIGPRTDPQPRVDPEPLPSMVKLAARLATPASELKPPYPASKIASGEEAVLRLRLTIDKRGRVVAVEPVDRTDRAFLDAARRHLMAHWRYKPATENGQPVGSTAVITLRFQLDG